MNRWTAYALALIGLLIMTATPANAHDSRPFSVNIEEQAAHRYLVRLHIPATVAPDNRPHVQWPSACRQVNEQQPMDQWGESLTLMIACPAGLEAKSLTIRYPSYNPSLATLFRLKRADGSIITQLLAPDEMRWTVPEQPSRGAVARSYLRLGIEHIWTGIDHLLFVAGLLILAGTLKRVLLAITGFTLAHSITLSLSALNLISVPVAPVEAAIALSILFLAREIAWPRPDGLARRYPIAVSSSFGLLHGFGFAAALHEVGLPGGELLTGLLSFNLGVEIGQVLFILIVIGVYLLIRRLTKGFSVTLRWAQARGLELAGYVLGIPAAYWFIERMNIAL